MACVYTQPIVKETTSLPIIHTKPKVQHSHQHTYPSTFTVTNTTDTNHTHKYQNKHTDPSTSSTGTTTSTTTTHFPVIVTHRNYHPGATYHTTTTTIPHTTNHTKTILGSIFTGKEYTHSNSLKTFCTRPFLPSTIANVKYVVSANGKQVAANTGINQNLKTYNGNNNLVGKSLSFIFGQYGIDEGGCSTCINFLTANLLIIVLAFIGGTASITDEALIRVITAKTAGQTVGEQAAAWFARFGCTEQQLASLRAAVLRPPTPGPTPVFPQPAPDAVETEAVLNQIVTYQPNEAFSGGYHDNQKLSFHSKSFINNLPVYTNRNINIPIFSTKGNWGIASLKQPKITDTFSHSKTIDNSDFISFDNGTDVFTNKKQTLTIFTSNKIANNFSRISLFTSLASFLIESQNLAAIPIKSGLSQKEIRKIKSTNFNKNVFKMKKQLSLVVGFNVICYNPLKNDYNLDYYLDKNNIYALLCVRASVKIMILWNIIYAYALINNVDVSNINYQQKFFIFVGNNLSNKNNNINFNNINEFFQELKINESTFNTIIKTNFELVDKTSKLSNLFILNYLLIFLDYDLTKYNTNNILNLIKQQNINIDVITQKLVDIFDNKLDNRKKAGKINNFIYTASEPDYGISNVSNGGYPSQINNQKFNSTKYLTKLAQNAVDNSINNYNPPYKPVKPEEPEETCEPVEEGEEEPNEEEQPEEGEEEETNEEPEETNEEDETCEQNKKVEINQQNLQKKYIFHNKFVYK